MFIQADVFPRWAGVMFLVLRHLFHPPSLHGTLWDLLQHLHSMAGVGDSHLTKRMTSSFIKEVREVQVDIEIICEKITYHGRVS